MNLLTKKTYPAFLLSLAFLLGVLHVFITKWLCPFRVSDQLYLGQCSQLLDNASFIFLTFVFFAVFLFSLPLAMPLAQPVLDSWKRFAAWGIPIALMPSVWLWYEMYRSSEGPVIVDALNFLLAYAVPIIGILIAWYLFTSLAIIITTWWQVRKGHEARTWSVVVTTTAVFVGIAFLVFLSWSAFLFSNSIQIL